MADNKPGQCAIELEFTFDRLLSVKLAQVYQLLVPDKAWLTGKERSCTQGESGHETGRDLCTGVFGRVEISN